MRVLVIGGTGLISTEITRLLAERGVELTLYNRGVRTAEVPDAVRIMRGDRTAYAAFEAQMADEAPFDAVIDMVAFLPDDVESAVRAFRGRVGQYVFCSTVDVYTKSGQSYPIREDAERKPLPSFPYALNKARCEEALFAAHQRGDLNVTAIRPAHTYGEGGRLLHTMGFGTYIVSRIRRELPIIVHGDGRSLWSACHRDDVARAFVGALGNSRAYGKAYHVTAEEWLTWDRYYQGVAQAMGVDELNLVHIPTSLLGKVAPEEAQWCVENFSHNNIFDNTAARRDLGFAYTIPWVQGIGRAIGWMEANGQVEDADDYPFYDRIITAWRRLRKTMINELGDLQG